MAYMNPEIEENKLPNRQVPLGVRTATGVTDAANFISRGGQGLIGKGYDVLRSVPEAIGQGAAYLERSFKGLPTGEFRLSDRNKTPMQFDRPEDIYRQNHTRNMGQVQQAPQTQIQPVSQPPAAPQRPQTQYGNMDLSINKPQAQFPQGTQLPNLRQVPHGNNGQMIPMVNNADITQNYAGLNDPVKNREQFLKNMADADLQRKATFNRIGDIEAAGAAERDLYRAKFDAKQDRGIIYGGGNQLVGSDSKQAKARRGMTGQSKPSLPTIKNAKRIRPKNENIRLRNQAEKYNLPKAKFTHNQKMDMADRAEKKRIDTLDRQSKASKTTYSQMLNDGGYMKAINALRSLADEKGKIPQNEINKFDGKYKNNPFSQYLALQQQYGEPREQNY